MTRVGKVARLPQAVREELNERLRENEPGNKLVAWLNSLPEVRGVLKREFGGRPLTEQNLSEWKPGGYRDWLRQHEALDMLKSLTERSDELAELGDGVEVGQRLAVVLGVQLAGMAEVLLADTTDPRERWQRLQELLQQLAQLRRGDQQAGRLQMDLERWQQAQIKSAEEKLAERAMLPLSLGLLEQFMGGGPAEEQGVSTENGEAIKTQGTESDLIRPDPTQSNQSRADARARETAKAAS
ncbi:MAG: hypothetical protein JWR69_4604 [Pedosphaera sp.]|nr:hypothetical protein [Pedosphaera sp.]